MSQENVEIIRLFNAAHEGENLIPVIEAGLARLPPDPDKEAVLAWMAEDPAWRHLHPDVEWGISALEVAPAKGAVEVAMWWASWVEVWESYSYRILDYRDLGAWVMTPVEIRLRGHAGTAVDLNMFEIWQVREGKITLVRILPSESHAVAAATRP